MSLLYSSRTQSSVASSTDNTDFHSVRFHPVQQSMAEPLSEWSTGLCDCLDDMKQCCHCFWCCCCLACDVSEQFGEGRCIPVFDFCLPACFAVCGIPFCVPPAGLSLRIGMRHRYGIKGTHLEDIGSSALCVCCSWGQMHRELLNRKDQTTPVVNAQPVAVERQAVPQSSVRLYPETGIVLASY